MTTPSKGQLIRVNELSEREDISLETINRIIREGYVISYKIGGTRFVHYRDFLRGSWLYEQNRKPGGRPRKNN